MGYYFRAIPEGMSTTLPINPNDYKAYLTLNLQRYTTPDEKIEVWHSDGLVDQVAWLVRERHDSLYSISSPYPTDPLVIREMSIGSEENENLLVELWEEKFSLFKSEVSECFNLHDENEDYLRFLKEYMVNSFGLDSYILHTLVEISFGDALSGFFAKLEKERKFRIITKEREVFANLQQQVDPSSQRSELDGRTQLRLLYTLKFLLNSTNISTQESTVLKIAEFLEFITSYDRENYRRWYNQPLRGDEKNLESDLKYVSEKLKLLGLTLTTEEVSDGILSKR